MGQTWVVREEMFIQGNERCKYNIAIIALVTEYVQVFIWVFSTAM